MPAAPAASRPHTQPAAALGPIGSPSLVGRGRRIRKSEVAVGLLITVGCALAAVLVHLGSVERTAVLAARVDIEQGHVIEAVDLEVVNLASDSTVAHIGRSDLDLVVGRTATRAIGRHELLAPGMTTDEDTLGRDEAAVGLALLPGQLPSLDLAPGARVHVVSSTAPTAEPSTTDGDDPVLSRSAEVVSVEQLDADRRLVTLLTSEADAEKVAAAAGDDSLRLVVVAS